MQSFAEALVSRLHKHKLAVAFFALITALSFFICFFQLGKGALENWDEAWYGEILRNMIRNNNLVIPYWNRTILLDKPPLQMWLSLPFALLFGVNEFSVRIVSAIAGFCTILLVANYSYRRWGLLPACFAFVTLALNNTYIWRVRSGNIDSLLTFLVVLVFLLIQSRWKHRYLIVGLIFSLIYLAKASIVIFPLGIFVLGEIIFERHNIRKNYRQYLAMLAIMLTVPLIWLMAGTVKVGWSFARYYLFQSDQGVSRISLKYLKPDYIMYLYYSLQRRFAYLFAVGAVFCIASVKKNKESFLLLCFATFLLFLLSFTERNNNWYLLPSMPFWSLVVAYAVNSLYRMVYKKKVIAFLSMSMLVVVSVYVSYKTFTVNVMPIIYAAGPVDQKQAGQEIERISRPKDIIIRTNDAYPTTVFYADRKILTYKPEITQIHATFIGKDRLKQCLVEMKCPFMTGTVNDTENLINELGPGFRWKQIYKSGDEVIMRLQ